jgi:hypothetical protein
MMIARYSPSPGSGPSSRAPWHQVEADPRPSPRLSADETFAHKVLKVNATPTFFINAERIKGAISFEEFDKAPTFPHSNLSYVQTENRYD